MRIRGKRSYQVNFSDQLLLMKCMTDYTGSWRFVDIFVFFCRILVDLADVLRPPELVSSWPDVASSFRPSGHIPNTHRHILNINLELTRIKVSLQDSLTLGTAKEQQVKFP